MTKSKEELLAETQMLRRELRTAREAAEITSELVVKQFEQTEQMLRRFQEANAQRQAVLDAATQLSIIATDKNGNIMLFSRGATNLLGYSAQDMEGKANILSLHCQEEISAYAQQISEARDQGQIGTGMDIFDQGVRKQLTEAREWTYVRQDGHHLPVSLSITPLHDARGRMTGYLFTAMDISDRKRLEYDLWQAKEEAEAANLSKGDFLARMSHEIRTPMNAVIGMTSLLRKTELNPKQQDYVQKILGSANTLLGIINDILDFSKIDAGKLELEEISFDLEEVLSNLFNAVGLRAEEKGLEFLFHIQPEVPMQLVGDPLRLGQVLMNLGTNAVKFTEQGEIVVKVGIREIHNDRVVLCFSVQDSGIGLNREQATSLFESFQQADGSITRKFGGSGLGLAICKQLVEMMNGQIWVESEPGQGAAFIFTAEFALQELQTEQHYVPPVLDGLKALVVDDNATARQILSSMLTSWEMNVECVDNGQEALDRLKTAARQNDPFDLVLLDWIMPHMDGIETAQRIKSEPDLAQVPAMLMVTANAREEAQIQAEKIGLDAFLLKPVYPSVIFNNLMQILGQEIQNKARVRPEDEVSDPKIQDLYGARILLAEDNALNQQVALGFLEEAQVQVDVVENGLQAVEAVADNSYDLVFMDIQMPELDGLEATRRIRQLETTGQVPDQQKRSGSLTDTSRSHASRIPIIAMTAHALDTDREKSLAVGMDDHINKPVKPEVLYRVLQRWLSSKGQTSFADGERSEDTQGQQKLVDLPSLPGIDPQESMKRLNYQEQLFERMVRDFVQAFEAAPAQLQDWAGAGRWSEVKDKAHAIKGLSGYLGAWHLQERAAELEDVLKKSGRDNQEAPFLPGMINALEQVLQSLNILKAKLPLGHDSGEDTSLLHSESKDLDFQTMTDNLRQIQDKLKHGELIEDESLDLLHQVLSGLGLEAFWPKLRELIDDIEYEAAASQIEDIMARVQHTKDVDINGR